MKDPKESKNLVQKAVIEQIKERQNICYGRVKKGVNLDIIYKDLLFISSKAKESKLDPDTYINETKINVYDLLMTNKCFEQAELFMKVNNKEFLKKGNSKLMRIYYLLAIISLIILSIAIFYVKP